LDAGVGVGVGVGSQKNVYTQTPLFKTF